MPKRIFIVPVVLLLCLGCAKDEKPKYTEEQLAQIPQPVRDGLPRPTGGFVLAVGDETISTTDIAQPLMSELAPTAQKMSFDDFANQAMPAVALTLRDKIADILLYQQAKKAAPDQIDEELDKAVEKEMRRFIVSFGGDYAKAQAYLKSYYGMGWKEFRDYQRRMILSGSYLNGKLAEDKPVTYSQIREYYDQHKSDDYSKEATITIRLIDIDVAKQAVDANTSQLDAAQSKANDLMSRLNAGENFAVLAAQYSDGYRASAGGLWDPVRPDSLAEPYDVLGKQAQQMAVGDVAGPLNAKGHIFIVKLEGKQAGSVVPLEKVQAEIEERITLERKRKSYDDAMNAVLKEADIGGLDQFAMYCLRQIYTQANSQM
jgi:parvulin-like peptidyl-prolyl isomerase